MKKALLLLAALVISFSVFAQSGPSGDSRSASTYGKYEKW